MEDIYILEGARTAFGSFGGSLKDVNTTQLGITASRHGLGRFNEAFAAQYLAVEKGCSFGTAFLNCYMSPSLSASSEISTISE
jgi:acetyl-CoA acetyltransferase